MQKARELIKITDISAPEVEAYVKLNEKQAKRIYEPGEGIFICESMKVVERALRVGYVPISFYVAESKADEISTVARRFDVPVYYSPEEVMRDITGYSLTGGVLSAMRRKPLKGIAEILDGARYVVILDDIENPTNVGAIFRSSAAMGADAILLTEGCADPLYRRAARVSMGAVFQAQWTFIQRPEAAVLREKGFQVISLALSEDAVRLGEEKTDRDGKFAVIFGNEDHGISRGLLEISDHTVMIPMENEVDSLNVAAASAVALWEIFHR